MSQSHLSSRWRSLPLKETGKIITGSTPSTAVPEYYGGPYMFISPGDIDDSEYVTKTQKYLSEEGLKASRAIPRDTVLTVCIGATIGKTALTSAEQSATNQQINAIVPNERTDAHFLYYAIKHRSSDLPLLAGRAAVPIVNKSIFGNFEIPFPPLLEQQAIAYALRTVQKGMEVRRRELKLERERKAALMQHLFTYGTRGEPLKQVEVGKVPESWQLIKIGEVAHLQYGYQTSIPSEPPSNGVEIISTAEIQNAGYLALSKIRTVEIPQNQIAKYAIAKNDILFNWRNSQEHVGKTALVDFTPARPLIFASFIVRMRAKEGMSYQYLHYLLSYLRQDGLFFRLSRRAVGQANFNANQLAELQVRIPSPSEQEYIAECLLDCDRKVAALQRESAVIEELFRAMLEELMIGRLSAMPLIAGVGE